MLTKYFNFLYWNTINNNLITNREIFFKSSAFASNVCVLKLYLQKSLFGGGSNDFCFLADCVTVCVESEVYWDPPVAFPLMSGVFGLDSSFWIINNQNDLIWLIRRYIIIGNGLDGDNLPGFNKKKKKKKEEEGSRIR